MSESPIYTKVLHRNYYSTLRLTNLRNQRTKHAVGQDSKKHKQRSGGYILRCHFVLLRRRLLMTLGPFHFSYTFAVSASGTTKAFSFSRRAAMRSASPAFICHTNTCTPKNKKTCKQKNIRKWLHLMPELEQCTKNKCSKIR